MKEITFFVTEERRSNQFRSEKQLKENLNLEVVEIAFKLISYDGIKVTVLYYCLLKLLKIFKNKVYIGIILSNKKKVISSAVCPPRSFRYPFMSKQDYQIGAVNTDFQFRQKGLSFILLNEIMKFSSDFADRYWYVSYSENRPSLALARKLGFTEEGTGYKKKYSMFPFLSKYIISKKEK